jgi:uncharacterized protein Veg
MKSIKEMLFGNQSDNLNKAAKQTYQIEEFDGVIEELYNSIFIIRIINDKTIKSFTYCDVITKSLEIFV